MSKRQWVVATLIPFILFTCSLAVVEEPVCLQFRPKTGVSQTVRVNSKLATTHQRPSGPDCTEHITTVTVQVEPTRIANDGNVVVKITFLKMVLDSHRKSDGLSFLQYDSSNQSNKSNASSGQYGAHIGESFIVIVSARGEIVELRTDTFYTAVAANRMKHEDDALRALARRYKGKEDIKQQNDKYGSAEKRKLAYKEDASSSAWYGTDRLRLLVNQMLVPLAGEPVKDGAEWKGPVMVSVEYPMEMVGTYTLKSVDDTVCTIQAQAQRNPDDKLPKGPGGRRAVGSKLGGIYQATLKVDRATGSLLSRESVMNLTGDIFMPGSRSANPEGSVPVTMEATTTVEIVE